MARLQDKSMKYGKRINIHTYLINIFLLAITSDCLIINNIQMTSLSVFTKYAIMTQFCIFAMK